MRGFLWSIYGTVQFILKSHTVPIKVLLPGSRFEVSWLNMKAVSMHCISTPRETRWVSAWPLVYVSCIMCSTAHFLFIHYTLVTYSTYPLVLTYTYRIAQPVRYLHIVCFWVKSIHRFRRHFCFSKHCFWIQKKRFNCVRQTFNLLPSIPMKLIIYRYVVVSLQIASGSDDLCAIIWDWERERKLLSFKTGHTSNVFQVSACTAADPVRSGYSGSGAVWCRTEFFLPPGETMTQWGHWSLGYCNFNNYGIRQQNDDEKYSFKCFYTKNSIFSNYSLRILRSKILICILDVSHSMIPVYSMTPKIINFVLLSCGYQELIYLYSNLLKKNCPMRVTGMYHYALFLS